MLSGSRECQGCLQQDNKSSCYLDPYNCPVARSIFQESIDTGIFV